jgi:hypothetical protein
MSEVTEKRFVRTVKTYRVHSYSHPTQMWKITGILEIINPLLIFYTLEGEKTHIFNSVAVCVIVED